MGALAGRWTAEEHLHAIALREYLVVTREVDPTANEEARVEYVTKGYRGDNTARWRPGVHGVHRTHPRRFLPEPGREARGAYAGRTRRPDRRDEARHEEFFSNLVAHCLEYTRDETIAAIAARPPNSRSSALTSTPSGQGAKRRRCRHFGDEQLRQAISDRIAHGLADEAALSNSSSAKPIFAPGCECGAPARCKAATRVASFSMVSVMLCCPGGTSRQPREGPAPVLVSQFPPTCLCGSARA